MLPKTYLSIKVVGKSIPLGKGIDKNKKSCYSLENK
jgi:hypothetical protein